MLGTRVARWWWLTLLVVLLVSCGGGSGCCASAPHISSFTAAKQDIVRGETVQLSWTVQGASLCSLHEEVHGAIENVEKVVDCVGGYSGPLNAPESADYVDFTLRASNSSSDDSSTIRITFIEAEYTTDIVTFKVHPLQVAPGEELTITWEAVNTGTFEGVDPCSVSRRSEFQSPGEAVTMSTSCKGSITEVPEVAAGATYVRYQFNALKDVFEVGGDPTDAFLYATVNVTVLPEPLSGELDWTVRLGDSSDGGLDVDIDSNGNIWAVGWTYETSTGYDALVHKLDPNGSQILSRTIATSGAETAEAVAIDPSDAVIVVGTTTGVIGTTSAGGRDAYVRKYDGSGSTVWTRQFGTTSDDYGAGVVTDSTGNVYIVGTTYGSLQGTSRGSGDAFIRKYLPDGQVGWTLQLGSSSSDGATAVAVDSAGNIVIVGRTSGAMDPADPADGAQTRAFVMKVTAEGTNVWTRHIEAPASHAHALAVTIDSSDAVLVAGYTLGNVASTGSEGGEDAFVVKLDSAGTRLWSWQDGTIEDERAYAVTIDAHDNVTVSVGNPPEDPPGPGGNGGGAFLTKLYSTGQHVWTNRFDEHPWVTRPSALITDSSGHPLVVGDSYKSTGGNDYGAFTLIRFKP